MTNLDSVLKSRKSTLSVEVHIAKAMVSPVIMCGFESWTIKKAKCQRIDAFAGRNINNLRYTDDTTIMAESEEEIKSLLMKVKE